MNNNKYLFSLINFGLLGLFPGLAVSLPVFGIQQTPTASDLQQPTQMLSANLFGPSYTQTSVQGNIQGSVTNNDQRIGYVVGTDKTDNPAIGFDFYVEGDIDYDYNFPFKVDIRAPDVVYPNQTLNFSPVFKILNDNAYLNTTQTYDYGTEFFFGFEFDVPLIPTVEVYETVDIPNISYGPAYITAEGKNEVMSTHGDEVIHNSPNSYLIETNQERNNAWGAGIDFIEVAAEFVPVIEPIDWLGFDLNLELGMDVLRQDIGGLSNFYFNDYQDVEYLVPDNLEAGSTYEYDLDLELDYQLIFQSFFDYGGDISLLFDGPFFSEIELASLDLGTFDVAHPFLSFDQTIDIPLSFSALVGDPGDCIQLNILSTSCPNTVPEQDKDYVSDNNTLAFVDQNVYMTSVYSDVAADFPFVIDDDSDVAKYYQEEYYASVPEPGTLLLLAGGFLGLAGMSRRRKDYSFASSVLKISRV